MDHVEESRCDPGESSTKPAPEQEAEDESKQARGRREQSTGEDRADDDPAQRQAGQAGPIPIAGGESAAQYGS